MKHQIETRIIFQLVFIIEGWIDSSPGLGYNIQIDYFRIFGGWVILQMLMIECVVVRMLAFWADDMNNILKVKFKVAS